MTKIKKRIADWIWLLKQNKKHQLVLAASIGVLAILVVVTIVLARSTTSTTVDAQLEPTTIETLPLDQRRLDGVAVDEADNNYLPIAVMIENLVTVRPQSGLQQAGVVYEALAEGGITRFMAVYADHSTLDRIGPVRSARPYFVDWAEEYGGIYAHAGGSPQALELLSDDQYLTHLNQISGDHPYFVRDASLEAPHNLFTDMRSLIFAQRDKGLEDALGDYDSWVFTPSRTTDATPLVSTITLPFSSTSYEVVYQYNQASKTYQRFNGGEPHLDTQTQQQITVKNILVQSVNTSLLEVDSGRLAIETIGEGTALLFRDGTVTPGRWNKTSRGERTRFVDDNGQAMEFAPGNTWIEVLPSDRTAAYDSDPTTVLDSAID